MLLGGNETTGILDRYAINTLKIPGIILMENAAAAFMSELDCSLKSYLVVCGKGNNGGDGYAIARHLKGIGKNVSIFSVSTENMSKDCKINYDICKNLNIPMYNDIENLENIAADCDILIDSIFGTGLNCNISGIYYEVIKKINSISRNTKIYSVDIPSGIDGNTGEILGIAVKAHKTVSFTTYKKAFLNLKSSDYFGNIAVKDIGISPEIFSDITSEYYLTLELINKKIIGRKKNSHKGNFGRIGIFAGCRNFSGAGIITVNSCIRSGAGLVTFMTFNDTLLESNLNTLPEAMTVNIDPENLVEYTEKIDEFISKSDVIALGPGIGKSETSLKVIKRIFKAKKNEKGVEIKLIIDADALNLLSEHMELFKEIEGRAILTPHIVEFSRLSGFTPEEIEKDRKTEFIRCREFANKYNIILLVKGENTLITDGNSVYINSTGNPYMANGGMGDCLTGIIAALAGQGYSLLESAFISAFLHGYIGDRMAEGQYIVNATHIIENIPRYMKELFEN